MIFTGSMTQTSAHFLVPLRLIRSMTPKVSAAVSIHRAALADHVPVALPRPSVSWLSGSLLSPDSTVPSHSHWVNSNEHWWVSFRERQRPSSSSNHSERCLAALVARWGGTGWAWVCESNRAADQVEYAQAAIKAGVFGAPNGWLCTRRSWI